jgi:hypothetical protein
MRHCPTVTAPAPSLVRIIDEALPAPLFKLLSQGVKKVGSERLKNTYQTTFWYPLEAPPSCVPEACALALLPRLPSLPDVIGVEWWLSRMRTNDVRVDFHQDRDEQLALERGKTVHPRMSSVLFLNEARGGLLAVTAEPPNDDNPSRAPDLLDFELVRPKANRFTYFEGSLTHGVLDANNQIPDGPVGRKTPLRLALILNWWQRVPHKRVRLEETRAYRPLMAKGG